MKQPNIFKRFIRWWKIYYWNVVWDLPRNEKRTGKEKLRWILLFPYYGILRQLARRGFLRTTEGAYMRLRDFTPFFWRTLIERAVESERSYWQSQLRRKEYDFRRVLETARRDAQEEVFEYLEERFSQE